MIDLTTRTPHSLRPWLAAASEVVRLCNQRGAEGFSGIGGIDGRANCAI